MRNQDNGRNLVAAISYILGFVTGIVILMVEKDDKFIRFHAMQSTIATGSLFVLNVILGIVFGKFGIFSFLSVISGLIIYLLIFYVCIISFINAYKGKVYKLPIFGNMAEKRVN